MLLWESCTQFMTQEAAHQCMSTNTTDVCDSFISPSCYSNIQIADREGHMSCCLNVVPSIASVSSNTLSTDTNSTTATYLLVCGGYCASERETAEMLIGRRVDMLYREVGRSASLLGESDVYINGNDMSTVWYELGQPLTYSNVSDTQGAAPTVAPKFLLERDGASLVSIPINVATLQTRTKTPAISLNGDNVDGSSFKSDAASMNYKTDVRYIQLFDGAAIGFGGLDGDTEATDDLFALWLVDSEERDKYIEAKGHDEYIEPDQNVVRDQRRGCPFALHPRVQAVGEVLSCHRRKEGNNYFVPCARYRHSCTSPVAYDKIHSSADEMGTTVSSPVKFRLYFFGGEDADGKALNDIWCLEGCAILNMLHQSQQEGGDISTITPTLPKHRVSFESLEWTLVRPYTCPTAGPTPRLLSCIVGASFWIGMMKVSDDSIPSNSCTTLKRLDYLVIYGGSVINTTGGCDVIPKNDMWLIEVTEAEESNDDDDNKDPQFQLRANYYLMDLPLLPSVNGHVGLIIDYSSTGITTQCANSEDVLAADLIFSFSALFYGGKEFDTGSNEYHMVTFSSKPFNGAYKVDLHLSNRSNESPLSYKYQCIPCPYHTLLCSTQANVQCQEGRVITPSTGMLSEEEMLLVMPKLSHKLNPLITPLPLLTASGTIQHDHSLHCPYSAYVKYEGSCISDDSTGGIGSGIWPHWRYMSALAVASANGHSPRVWGDSGGGVYADVSTSVRLPVFLVGGQCRHADPNVPVYQLVVKR